MVTEIVAKCVSNSGLIWRGPRPELASDSRVLREKYGITSMLDLQGDWWETLTPAANKREYAGWCSGIRSTRIALNSFLPPHRDDVELALRIISQYEINGVLVKRLYVHCRRGVDRTGFVIAAFRMRHEGWTYDAAVAEMKSMGFHPWYFYWLPRLKRDWSRR